MEITVREFDALSEDEMDIRREVFMNEQGFMSEFDQTDQKSHHIVMYDEDIPIACCRYYKKEHDDNCYIIGRLAVKKKYRGQHIGKKMLDTAMTKIAENGGKTIMLHAQCDKQEFYARQGYEAFGEIENDENCPHIWMKKEL